jgi:adenylate cyclase
MADEDPNLPAEPDGNGPSRAIADRARKLNRDPILLGAVRGLRRVLPGDSRYGDPLSTAGSQQSQVLARRVAELDDESLGVVREASLGAQQVWQALSERAGRGHGDQEVAIVFTDLVEFSTWSLGAGDTLTLDLLRLVSTAVEPPVKAHGGHVVKRLGDGMMAVFRTPADAVAALREAMDNIDRVDIAGYRPRMRAGVHVGSPRRIGDDYLGVDVNVASRIAGHAGPGEILVSDRALEGLDRELIDARRRWLFRAKGVPRDVAVHVVRHR